MSALFLLRRLPVAVSAVAVVALVIGAVAAPAAAQPGLPGGSSRPTSEGVRLRRVGDGPVPGTVAAVVVEAGRLVHTAMLLPRQPATPGAEAAATQIRDLLAQLDLVLAAAGTTLDNVVRLHVYVATADVTAAVDAALASRFAGDSRPALTLVEMSLPDGALVALDAVAATARMVPSGRPLPVVVAGVRTYGRGASASIQPDGPYALVSGRAAPGNAAEAVRETVAQLRADLVSVGLGLPHVAHIKSFVTDLTGADAMSSALAAAVGGTADQAPPPQVFGEWTGGSVPAEIELVAVGPVSGGPAGAAVSFVEPVSSRFSRVARVMSGRPVYVSGLYGTSADPAAQIDEIFAQLTAIAAAVGSDMRHLVKATYYVTDRAADERINTIRPTVYAADAPPAASKISVPGLGRAGRGATIDMILVAPSR